MIDYEKNAAAWRSATGQATPFDAGLEFVRMKASLEEKDAEIAALKAEVAKARSDALEEAAVYAETVSGGWVTPPTTPEIVKHVIASGIRNMATR